MGASASPLFASSAMKMTSLRRCSFSNQISPIIFSRKSNEILKSKFSHFLSSAVHVAYESDGSMEKMDIKDGIFSDLRNVEQGGAVLVKNPVVALRVYHTMFVGCSAVMNGGALFANCARLDIEQSMFLECFVSDAAWSGQSFYTMCNIVNGNCSTVISCPPTETHRGSEAVIMVGGVQSIHQLNSSHNIAAQYAGGLATSESVSFALRMSMFYYDESPNHILALVHLRPDDDISYCNIIHNTVHTDGILFISGGYSVIRRCVFRKNTGTLAVFNNAYGPGFLTLEECSIDVPEPKIMEGQNNLFNLGSTFTKKPSKNAIPKNPELNSDHLDRMFRFINMK